jgi:bifunctional DNA-binding transcriptional regulator/antitoxin component of YhaV-PrlF toxin-antitoxin module
MIKIARKTKAMTPNNEVRFIEATLDSRGRFSLPKELRVRFGITDRQRVRFSMYEDGVIEIEPVPVSLHAVKLIDEPKDF